MRTQSLPTRCRESARTICRRSASPSRRRTLEERRALDETKSASGRRLPNPRDGLRRDVAAGGRRSKTRRLHQRSPSSWPTSRRWRSTRSSGRRSTSTRADARAARSTRSRSSVRDGGTGTTTRRSSTRSGRHGAQQRRPTARAEPSTRERIPRAAIAQRRTRVGAGCSASTSPPRRRFLTPSRARASRRSSMCSRSATAPFYLTHERWTALRGLADEPRRVLQGESTHHLLDTVAGARRPLLPACASSPRERHRGFVGTEASRHAHVVAREYPGRGEKPRRWTRKIALTSASSGMSYDALGQVDAL